MRIIVTRPEREALAWTEQLQARGLNAVALPLIAIGPAPGNDLRQCWDTLHSFDAVMFVSSNAAQYFFESKQALAPVPWSQIAPKTRAWSPGPGTARTLLAAGVPPHVLDTPPPDAGQFDSEALWDVVHSQVRPGHRTLVVRGQEGDADATPHAGTGREWLARQLAAAGGSVDFTVAYTRHAPQFTPPQHQTALAAAGDGSVWLFSSSQAVQHLQQWLPGQSWQAARAIATHPRIAQAAEQAGFGVVRASRPTLDAVVASIESLP